MALNEMRIRILTWCTCAILRADSKVVLRRSPPAQHLVQTIAVPYGSCPQRRCNVAGSVVEWAVDFGINRAGVTLQWSFAFAAYSDFTSDLPSLDAAPTQTATAAAGTPGNTRYNAKLLQVGFCVWIRAFGLRDTDVHTRCLQLVEAVPAIVLALRCLALSRNQSSFLLRSLGDRPSEQGAPRGRSNSNSS